MYIMGKIQVCVRDEWRLNSEVADFSTPTMPYVPHSLEVKERELALWDDPQLCEHVIDMLGVSRASIYRFWVYSQGWGFSFLTHQLCRFESI